MRKILALLLTAGTILIVVMAAMDCRPGLWQHTPHEQPSDMPATVDTLPMADTTQSVCAVDTLSAPEADTTANISTDDNGRK